MIMILSRFGTTGNPLQSLRRWTFPKNTQTGWESSGQGMYMTLFINHRNDLTRCMLQLQGLESCSVDAELYQTLFKVLIGRAWAGYGYAGIYVSLSITM